MWSSWERIWTFDDSSSCGARLILKPAVEALRRLGKDVREVHVNINDPDVCRKLREDLLAYEPDILFFANHPSSLYLDQMGMDNVDCPVLIWIFDDPSLMSDKPFADHEYILITDPSFEQGVRARGGKNILFLPVAAPDRVNMEFQQEHATQVSYVGSIHIKEETRRKATPEIQRYLLHIIQRKVHQPHRSFEELMIESPFRANQQIRLTGHVRYFLYSETNRLYRLQFIQQLIPFHFHLYGNHLWSSQLNAADIQRCFKGFIDPFTEYPRVIHSTKININLRSLQGFQAPTHRDFLVPRLGGFMLSTEINPPQKHWTDCDPENKFKLDRFPWSPGYQTPEELKEGITDYLADDKKRSDWIQAAQEEIELHHTYTTRMQQLGELIDSMPNS